MDFKELDTEKLHEFLGRKRFKVHPAQIPIIEKELISRGEKIPSDEHLIWLANNNSYRQLSAQKSSTKVLYGLIVLGLVLNCSGYLLFIGIPLIVFCSIWMYFESKPGLKGLFNSFLVLIIGCFPVLILSLIFSSFLG